LGEGDHPMARFLITYHTGDMPQDPESIAQARRAFVQWAAKAGAALADIGAPIRSATTISNEGTHDGAPAGPFMGWSVIEAEDGNTAVRLLADHPFISRGGMLQLSEPICRQSCLGLFCVCAHVPAACSQVCNQIAPICMPNAGSDF